MSSKRINYAPMSDAKVFGSGLSGGEFDPFRVEAQSALGTVGSTNATAIQVEPFGLC